MKAGFYKLNGITLMYAEIGVYSQAYTMECKAKDKYKYPIDGWYWFASEAEARKFFGLPEVEESTPETAEIDKQIEVLQTQKTEIDKQIEVLQTQKTEIKRKTAIDRAKIVDAEFEFIEAVGRV